MNPEQITAAIYKYFEDNNDDRPRQYLGASIIGHHCDRWLWYSFRWAIAPAFPGRVLRLFRRGQLEETTVAVDLQNIGLEPREVLSQQITHDICPHIKCTPDGRLLIDGTQTTLEIKTHSIKSFADLEKNKVKDSKPQHWAQMQIEMMAQDTRQALYFAVCKDNDSLHLELVEYDEDAASSILERGKRIALAERMPEPVSADPTWYKCTFCDAKPICHEKQPTRQVNCRTCAHSTALQSGGWFCEHWDDAIPAEHQYDGCPHHVLHPDLVPWELLESEKPGCAAYKVGKVKLHNGLKGDGVYSSFEMIAAADKAAQLHQDEVIAAMRKTLDAEFV